MQDPAGLEWDDLLRAAARLQRIVPDAVLVGGTAAAEFARHRMSFDDDHVVADLRDRFDSVLGDLEATDGWITARIKRPVLILGRLDGVETGVRNLVRRKPLEIEIHATPHGPIRVPTLQEMLRIKGWLVLVRNATRDYLDVVALAERIGPSAADVLLAIDRYYEDQQGPDGMRVATQIARQLAEPRPYDLSEVDLMHYRRLAPRWQSWPNVAIACRTLAMAMIDRLPEAAP